MCSRTAKFLVDGRPRCHYHGKGGTTISVETMIQALRQIATGHSGDGVKTDLAVCQTIAKAALGMLPNGQLDAEQERAVWELSRINQELGIE